jgi:hypothetical protein
LGARYAFVFLLSAIAIGIVACAIAYNFDSTNLKRSLNTLMSDLQQIPGISSKAAGRDPHIPYVFTVGHHSAGPLSDDTRGDKD